MKKLSSLFLVLLVMVSCQNNESEAPVLEEPTFEINQASNAMKTRAKTFTERISAQKPQRFGTEGETYDPRFNISSYDVDNLEELKLSYGGASQSAYAVVNPVDSNVTLNFDLNQDGDVTFVYFSESVHNEDGSVESKIYNVAGDLKVHMMTYGDGTRELLKAPNANEFGWWSDFVDGVTDWFYETSECVGAVTSPTDTALIDMAFVTAATIVTNGWFIPATIAACGIAEAVTDLEY